MPEGLKCCGKNRARSGRGAGGLVGPVFLVRGALDKAHISLRRYIRPARMGALLTVLVRHTSHQPLGLIGFDLGRILAALVGADAGGDAVRASRQADAL
jgi:hypothetical protein